MQGRLRVTSRLTLNLGLRYEIDGVEKNGMTCSATSIPPEGWFRWARIYFPYHGITTISARVWARMGYVRNGKTYFAQGRNPIRTAEFRCVQWHWQFLWIEDQSPGAALTQMGVRFLVPEYRSHQHYLYWRSGE